jgi:hypothetical protein
MCNELGTCPVPSWVSPYEAQFYTVGITSFTVKITHAMQARTCVAHWLLEFRAVFSFSSPPCFLLQVLRRDEGPDIQRCGINVRTALSCCHVSFVSAVLTRPLPVCALRQFCGLVRCRFGRMYGTLVDQSGNVLKSFSPDDPPALSGVMVRALAFCLLSLSLYLFLDAKRCSRAVRCSPACVGAFGPAHRCWHHAQALTRCARARAMAA